VSDAFWVAALKPFALLVMLIPSIPITLAVRRWMKAGRLKTLLLDRTLTERHPWVAVLAIVLCYVLLFGSCAYHFP
jgi:hypothetical protein